MKSHRRARAFGEFLVIGTTIATFITNLPDSVIDLHRIHTRSPYSFPNWRFFGPIPGTKNIYLYSRWVSGDGGWSDWSSVVPDDNRTRFPLLGNPGNRNEKVLIDLAGTFTALFPTMVGDSDKLIMSDPYQRLLRIGRSLTFPTGAETAQLMLVEVQPETGQSFSTPSPLIVTEPFGIKPT